ncbi:ROK family transcriptional regulator [Candidatus Halocynthiibacter alkanivorans]|uniref:ROK family transcriptional regulator n=1 Tax=Candidatus Halocynthiibacter alkanivorans TaxID=2267619 RepID=UPI000DF29D86|nr:ROK family transcriptional regulator [Candidatus Halocynthiibacter alkanivorans]
MGNSMLNDPRDAGRRAVFGAIRKAQRIARVDVARETGISPATVTAITAELIREGLIEETGPSAARSDLRRGRPRVDLKVRGAARVVAGAKLSNQTITVALLDFEGTLLGEGRTPLTRTQYSPEEFVPILIEAIEDAVKSSNLTMGDLAGIGLGLAGIVDAERGLVYWSPNFSSRNIGLRDLVQHQLDLPVFIDNDANLVAMAEQFFGHGRGVSDFIVITIESGVGMGIVIDNEIYRGTGGRGAEFGHTKVQLDGALCRCGQRGCLEAYVADYALLREATTTTDLTDADTAAERLQLLFDAAKNGDTTAKSILDRAGRMFAMGLANMVNVFDPKLIILSGERMQADFLYAEDVIANLEKSIVQIDMPPPEVKIHKWGDLMWAKGAGAYAIAGVADLALQRITENAV